MTNNEEILKDIISGCEECNGVTHRSDNEKSLQYNFKLRKPNRKKRIVKEQIKIYLFI